MLQLAWRGLVFTVHSDLAKVQCSHAIHLLHLKVTTVFVLAETYQPLSAKDVETKSFGVITQRLSSKDDKHGMPFL